MIEATKNESSFISLIEFDAEQIHFILTVE